MHDHTKMKRPESLPHIVPSLERYIADADGKLRDATETECQIVVGSEVLRAADPESERTRHTWTPDPDDPPLVAPYCDPFCALLTGYALGALTVAAIGLIAWAVLR